MAWLNRLSNLVRRRDVNVFIHVERLWREIRLYKIAPISQQMALNYLSEHVLGLPRSY